MKLIIRSLKNLLVGSIFAAAIMILTFLGLTHFIPDLPTQVTKSIKEKTEVAPTLPVPGQPVNIEGGPEEQSLVISALICEEISQCDKRHRVAAQFKDGTVETADLPSWSEMLSMVPEGDPNPGETIRQQIQIMILEALRNGATGFQLQHAEQAPTPGA